MQFYFVFTLNEHVACHFYVFDLFLFPFFFFVRIVGSFLFPVELSVVLIYRSWRDLSFLIIFFLICHFSFDCSVFFSMQTFVYIV